jgi:hypothetical protein
MLDDAELLRLGGDGPAIVARVVDSDVAEIFGLVDGAHRWSWVFGEATLAAMKEGAGQPGPDPEELEATFPARAEETTDRIIAWSEQAGLVTAGRNAVLEALQHGHVFAEEGLHQLLAVAGVRPEDGPGQYVELTLRAEEPTADRDAYLRELRRLSETWRGIHASAIDHRSAGWQSLVGGDWLHGFGEPSALVAIDGSVYLASDPPVHTSDFSAFPIEQVGDVTGATGGWVNVPEQHAGSVADAAAWARANVGTAGAPPSADRPKLNFEVPTEAAEEVSFDAEAFRYSVAPTSQVGLELAMGESLLDHTDSAADWLDHARQTVAEPVFSAWAERGGQVEYGNDGSGTPYALGVSAWFETVTGRRSTAKATDASWARLLKRVRAGEIASVSLCASVMNGSGYTGPTQLWGDLELDLVLAGDPEFWGIPAVAAVTISEPMRALLGRPFVSDLVSRAAGLPVVGGFVDSGRSVAVGRWTSPYEHEVRASSRSGPGPRFVTRGPAWVLLLGEEHLRLVGGRQALEATGLFPVMKELQSAAGSLLWLQTTEHQDDCTRQRRREVAEALRAIMPRGDRSVD